MSPISVSIVIADTKPMDGMLRSSFILDAYLSLTDKSPIATRNCFSRSIKKIASLYIRQMMLSMRLLQILMTATM